MSRLDAEKHGAPTGDKFEKCFGNGCESILAIRFEPFSPGEVPKDPPAFQTVPPHT